MSKLAAGIEKDARLEQIPLDFPRPSYLALVSEDSKSRRIYEHQGRFYAPGCSPHERFEHWKFCEELAQHLAEELLEAKSENDTYLSEAQILTYYLCRLIATRWTSEVEARWIARRSAKLLGWKTPESILALETNRKFHFVRNFQAYR